MTRRLLNLSAIAMLATAPSLLHASGKANETRLRAQLTGARINSRVPSGHAEFRASTGRQRLNVEVEDVDLPAGTVLDVYLDGNAIGTIRIQGVEMGGELELNSQDGAMVPHVVSGTVVTVKAGDRGIVSGVF